ncbi:MAG: response regulator transcription factor [Saprospiraceae bacterium]|nr:response regulator transcription factor [Saprospiraceae bacterium]
MKTPISILLADDHQLLIDGIKAILSDEDQFVIAGEAHNGKEVLDFLKTDTPDVLIMDINMPEMDGIETLKVLQGENKDLKIIILSSYDDIRLIKEVLKMGVDSYLTKSSAAENILNAVNAVIKGKKYFDEDVQAQMIKAFPGVDSSKNKRKRSREGVMPISLTNREIDVLRLIAQEYSSREIGEQLFLSSNTVETHRKNLIKKLNVKNSIGLVKYAIQYDLV